MPEVKFPKGFLWGASTSSYQVEGGNFNDWSEWEKENAGRLGKKARTYWQKWQQEKFPEMLEKENYISGRACDHYHRFEEDFNLAKELGHNAHRFSIEWSRIEPKKGKIDQKEIEHYHQVLLALKERGIEPFVTLYHWTLPTWLAEEGGWLNPKAPYYFDRYVKIISENFFEEVKYWITLNEPNIYAFDSYFRGVWPPQKKSVFKYFKVLKNLVKSHKLAYRSLHLIDLDCQVGVARNNVYFENIPLADYLWNKRFLDKIGEEQDFIGLNYYFHKRLFGNRNKSVNDLGWEIYPEGIYHVLRGLEKYKKPIYITENGLADKDDTKREKFIKDHLEWTAKAIKEGVDVRGYFYWSLLDNFEWDKGFWPRFGLIEVDFKTMERKIRPSAFKYTKICKENKL
ncbi:MAG: glycoside hydrolase family 1 protein [Candidatus Portnoybacteria bacterium]